MRYIALLSAVLILTNSVVSQTAELKRKEIKFSVCRPRITEAGRQSSFQFSYRFRVLTDKTALVKEAKEITDNSRFRSLMNDEDLIPCIKEWKLESSQRYIVTIFVGTTSEQQFFSISGKTVNIKILL